MAFRIVTILSSFGETRYYLQKRYKILFIPIWLTVRNFKFPFVRKLTFLSKSEAKKFVSEESACE
ncbi:MAG: hypothetical protein P4L27_01765 [Ignavibacteriaceae bacterium]|nr:hypothetical protein [Ignavibacteriaceae bacterium]